ncbi:hypothetical protein B0H19DRAFT_1247623 [Mycena capillaripes]|nr:hypothetical protein B0H19DRAFT_1247623 [Mycena capillaripes]
MTIYTARTAFAWLRAPMKEKVVETCDVMTTASGLDLFSQTLHSELCDIRASTLLGPPGILVGLQFLCTPSRLQRPSRVLCLCHPNQAAPTRTRGARVRASIKATAAFGAHPHIDFAFHRRTRHANKPIIHSLERAVAPVRTPFALRTSLPPFLHPSHPSYWSLNDILFKWLHDPASDHAVRHAVTKTLRSHRPPSPPPPAPPTRMLSTPTQTSA